MRVCSCLFLSKQTSGGRMCVGVRLPLIQLSGLEKKQNIRLTVCSLEFDLN
jgi:hypothetical protein